MAYNINTHGDFKNWWCKKQKRTYWILGYFGGGSISISDAYELAKQYAKANNVAIETVQIDEVPSSRRYKYFKFIFSTALEQVPAKDSTEMDNVYEWLRD